MKKFSALLAALALTVSPALAQDAFAAADTDGSGTLSLTEIQAVMPDMTAETMAEYDSDGDGELSADEFAASPLAG